MATHPAGDLVAIVGREAESARLNSVLAAARNGVSSVLVVTGDAGVGKTSLLDFAGRIG